MKKNIKQIIVALVLLVIVEVLWWFFRDVGAIVYQIIGAATTGWFCGWAGCKFIDKIDKQ